jgi:hypothetical protein
LEVIYYISFSKRVDKKSVVIKSVVIKPFGEIVRLVKQRKNKTKQKQQKTKQKQKNKTNKTNKKTKNNSCFSHLPLAFFSLACEIVL